MSMVKRKKVSRHSREVVEEMREARRVASSRVMSDEEFLRQCPEEVRAQPLSKRRKSVTSSKG